MHFVSIKTLRRKLKYFLALAVLCIALLIATTWIIGGRLVASANRKVGPPPPDFPAQTIEVESDSGSKLAAWHLVVQDSNATVILLHPNRSDRRSMLSRARLLRQHGYSTLLVDLQAHGESGGKQITAGHAERHDVLAAVKYVRTYDGSQQIAIIGASLGGAATLLAEPSVDVIVLESVYPTISEAVHNRVQMRIGLLHHLVAPLLLAQLNPRLGISPGELRPIDHLANIECPIIIASGDSDRHTTKTETQRMYDKANPPKKLVIFDGASHEDLLAHDPVKYETEIVGHINNIMGPRHSPPKPAD